MFIPFQTIHDDRFNLRSNQLWADNLFIHATWSDLLKKTNYTGHILSSCWTLTSGSTRQDFYCENTRDSFRRDVNKQESSCCECTSDVSADLERAARMRAVAWPAWFWDRWSRKESAGSASTLAFSASTCTSPGNEAWSSTPKRCSLGNMEDVTHGSPWPVNVLVFLDQCRTKSCTESNCYGVRRQI